MNLSTSKKSILTYLALGIYISALLWATLFNREPFDTMSIIYPFRSYVLIFSGDISILWTIIVNILLFIPAGYFIQMFLKKDCIKTVLIGLGISLIIELIQLFTKLGSFEFDDLLHNSIGTLIGYAIYKKLPLNPEFNLKKLLTWSLITTIVTSLVIFSICKISNYITNQRMISYAALGDTADKKNLLVLNGKEGYANNTKVYISYQDDGSLKISGTSDMRSWFRIADLTLEPGTYTFSGLSGVAEKTVAIEIDYHNVEKDAYIRLAPDVGPVDSIEFTLDEEKEVRVYVGVYEGCDCDVSAKPVLYKN